MAAAIGSRFGSITLLAASATSVLPGLVYYADKWWGPGVLERTRPEPLGPWWCYLGACLVVGNAVIWSFGSLAWLIVAPPTFWLELKIARRILARRYDREGAAERLRLRTPD
ncbi:MULTISPECIES: hypothetical protein [Isoptericola]|uniref:hypothetical protein n=1 Tax=Isoptericola TaxID=254250 RepID=UPI00383A7CBE